MISVVYFNDGDRSIMVGAFLMRIDAENFIKNTAFTQGYKIADVEGQWQSWTNIRDCVSQQTTKEIKL